MGCITTNLAARWPNRLMPVAFAPNVTPAVRAIINGAINAWNNPAKGLPVRVVARTAEPDFVMFTMNPVRDFGDPVTQSTAGSSASQFLGRHGGMQLIFCSSNASSADIIHEIGHAFGLFHEQNREDRDANVIINWINIFPTAYSQFLKDPAGSDDHGTYDFKSIMHYGTNAYAINPTIPTITPVNPANTIAPASDLTPGDIAAIKFLYRIITVQPPPIVFDPPPITRTPPSFDVTVPGFTVHVPALTVTPPRFMNMQPPSFTVNPPDIQVPATRISAHPAPIIVDPPPITVTPPPVSV